MKISILIPGVCLLAFCSAGLANAAVITSGTVGDLSDSGVLVGTSNDPHNDTLDLVNEVISGANSPGFNGYNEAFDPDLPLATSFLDKLEYNEGNTTFDSENNVFTVNDFIWYTNHDTGGATADWMGQTLWVITDVTNIGSEPILAFEAKGTLDDSEIAYYVAKADATNAGFSVWSYDPNGINAVYVDIDGDLDTKFDAALNQNGKGYAISHISFYGAGGGGNNNGVVPEPSSLAMLGGAIGLAGLFSRRRKLA